MVTRFTAGPSRKSWYSPRSPQWINFMVGFTTGISVGVNGVDVIPVAMMSFSQDSSSTLPSALTTFNSQSRVCGSRVMVVTDELYRIRS